ncbi:sensor histidine kinase [Thermomonas sp.]
MLTTESFTPARVSSNHVRSGHRLHSVTGITLIMVGAIVLIGWFFDIGLLKAIRPGFASMKATTALGLLLSGIALWRLRVTASAGSLSWLGPACASAAALIALLTLGNYVAGWHPGLDNLLVSDSAQAIHRENPAHMSPSSASAMLFGNVALILLASLNVRRWRFAAAGSLSTVTLLLGMFGAAAYADLVPIDYTRGQATGMALHSALAFVILGSAGLHCSWVRAGWRWSIGAPVIVGSVLGMLVLVGLSLESFRSIRNSVENARAVEHTQEIRTVISELNAAYAITLSGERGFVITGHEHLLSPVTGNGQALRSERRLRELTAVNPAQQARLNKLHALAQQKLEFFTHVVDERRAGRTESAVRLVESGRGQALVDAIYAVTREMDREEQKLLAQRRAKLAISIERTLFILPTGTLVALALFLGALLHLNAEVTERRRVTATIGESEARYRSLVRATSQIVWQTDATGRVNGPLPDWQAFTGQTDQEVQQLGWANALHPDDTVRSLEAWTQAVNAKAMFVVDYRIRSSEGNYRSFLVRGVPVLNADDSVREWVGTCADVTDSRRVEAERTRAEAEILQLNTRLDQRVIERTAQLEAANRELEAFTYSVSHDLRAPLRGIDSFSRMVIEDYGPTLDDEGRRMLNVVRSESQRMGRLIDDLLAFSRVGRLEMRRQSIDMTDLVLNVVHKLDIAPERHDQVRILPLPNVSGDRNLIQQVWVNLLTNALKFSSHKASPMIEIGALAADGTSVYYVKDNGAGFDPRYVHKLFGVFQRLHTEEEFEGTGVGLALVQRIVQRHGGTVRAEGDVNKGATFYFTLPNLQELDA